jgi:L-lactate dehydrogenase complex protein LldG
MTSREAILSALRRAVPPDRPHPGHAGLGVRYVDPQAQFAEAVKSVGGTCVRVKDLAAGDAAMKEHPAWAGARRVATLVPGVGRPTVDLAAVTDPHQLEGVDFAVIPGELGVAENGAVWIPGATLPHRVLLFIAEHLVLVVPADRVVHDLHEAYGRIAVGPDYGIFVSGPSKTADIEQALVVGAHGARSCTVLVVG